MDERMLRGSCTSMHGMMNGQMGRAKVTPHVRASDDDHPWTFLPRDQAHIQQAGQQTLTFTCSCRDEVPGEGAGLLSPASTRGDEVPGEGAGLLSPASTRRVGAVPLQGLAGG